MAVIHSWQPQDLHRDSESGGQPRLALARVGSTGVVGAAFRKADSAAFSVVKLAGVGSTGVAFDFVVTDDKAVLGDLGKSVVFAVQVKKLADDADDLDVAGGGAEQYATVALAATSGVVRLFTLNVAAAAQGDPLDGAGEGDHVLIRIRRYDDDPNDTMRGRVLVLGVACYGY